MLKEKKVGGEDAGGSLEGIEILEGIHYLKQHVSEHNNFFAFAIMHHLEILY